MPGIKYKQYQNGTGFENYITLPIKNSIYLIIVSDYSYLYMIKKVKRNMNKGKNRKLNYFRSSLNALQVNLFISYNLRGQQRNGIILCYGI